MNIQSTKPHAKEVYDILRYLENENREVTTAMVVKEGLNRGVGNADKYLRMGAQTEERRSKVNSFPEGLPYFVCEPYKGNQKKWRVIKKLVANPQGVQKAGNSRFPYTEMDNRDFNLETGAVSDKGLSLSVNKSSELSLPAVASEQMDLFKAR